MTAPVVHSLREQIREHILEGIISGRWQPGERIVERRIATELEVSQTPVREALRELESLRLIESAPNKGVRVRNLTAADLEESYPVRAGLEAIAAELAAERLAEDCSALEPHVAALYEADRASDGTAQVRHTVGFHRELVRAAGNSVLLHTWEGLGIEVFTALSIRWLGTVQQSYAEEHEELVAAFRRRDPRIPEIVKAHVLGCAPARSSSPPPPLPFRPWGLRTQTAVRAVPRAPDRSAGLYRCAAPPRGRDQPPRTRGRDTTEPPELYGAHLHKHPPAQVTPCHRRRHPVPTFSVSRGFAPQPFDRSSITELQSPSGFHRSPPPCPAKDLGHPRTLDDEGTPFD